MYYVLGIIQNQEYCHDDDDSEKNGADPDNGFLVDFLCFAIPLGKSKLFLR